MKNSARLINEAEKEMGKYDNVRPRTLPSFLEYSIDVSLMQRFISIVAIDTIDDNLTIKFEIMYNGLIFIQSMNEPIEKDRLMSSITLKFEDFGQGDEQIKAARLRQLFFSTIETEDKTIGELDKITELEKRALATITKEFINSIIVDARIHCLAFAHARRLIYFIEDKIEIPLVSKKYLDLLYNATQKMTRAAAPENYANFDYGLKQLGRLAKTKGFPCGPLEARSLQGFLPPIIRNLEINIGIYSELYKKYMDVTTYIDKLILLYNTYIEDH
jgi:hypothetical protein